jgi:AraC-like DNA-binding protein
MLLIIVMMSGIVLGIFLGILLLTLERGNRKANHLLGIIMILSSLCVSDFAILKTGLFNTLPHLIGIASTLLFLIGPFFYFYLKTIMGNNVPLKGKALLHFVPFLVLIIYRLPFYLQSAENKLDIYRNDSFFKNEHRIIILIQAIHAIVYFIVLKKSASIYAQQINGSSDTERINLSWINKCLGFLAFIFGFVILSYGLRIMGFNFHPLYSVIIPLLISVTILSIGFIGLKQPIIFSHQQDNFKSKKYERSALTDDKADDHLKTLVELMEKEKLYLDSDLTLQKLASKMLISANHLSQVINDRTGQNFFDFINSYRIKTAQDLLAAPQGELLTILAIGQEAGFNSKSSFNTAFKKHTGLTPSQYKLQIQNQKSPTEA